MFSTFLVNFPLFILQQHKFRFHYFVLFHSIILFCSVEFHYTISFHYNSIFMFLAIIIRIINSFLYFQFFKFMLLFKLRRKNSIYIHHEHESLEQKLIIHFLFFLWKKKIQVQSYFI